MKVWLRRGYGCFVPVKNEVKARRRAAHWHRMNQGDKQHHSVIGLFIGRTLSEANRNRRQLYP